MKKELFLALICTLILSCEREPRKSPAHYTNLVEIEKAQVAALEKLDPYSVEKGQRVHFIETQEVLSAGNSAKILSKEWTVEVTDLENFPDRRDLTTLTSVNDKNLDENFIYEFKNVYSLGLSSRLQLLDQLNENHYTPPQLMKQFNENESTDSPQVDGLAFQNLQVKEVTLVPPELVKKAENCKNLKNCQIMADLITYDILFLLDDGSTQRHKVEWFISGQVPFFAGMLKQCATTVLPVDNSRVLVKQCREVVDFDASID